MLCKGCKEQIKEIIEDYRDRYEDKSVSDRTEFDFDKMDNLLTVYITEPPFRMEGGSYNVIIPKNYCMACGARLKKLKPMRQFVVEANRRRRK